MEEDDDDDDDDDGDGVERKGFCVRKYVLMNSSH